MSEKGQPAKTFRIAFAVDRVRYEAGEFTWANRPDCAILPDGRVVIFSYEAGIDRPRGVMVATVATATAAGRPLAGSPSSCRAAATSPR